ncbi:hypothetical protein J6590_066017 [Homalodisca vitripennis]|nr:hypothetical protein J6590_098015 [Homalodisca vitripennis]KAG8314286.1 hypothetical protein J6590_096122 [Homalodisca vitripennis]KAG8320556.1 hypothetical protein J6590_066017 [Homalodisca vitripennis]
MTRVNTKNNVCLKQLQSHLSLYSTSISGSGVVNKTNKGRSPHWMEDRCYREGSSADEGMLYFAAIVFPLIDWFVAKKYLSSLAKDYSAIRHITPPFPLSTSLQSSQVIHFYPSPPQHTHTLTLDSLHSDRRYINRPLFTLALRRILPVRFYIDRAGKVRSVSVYVSATHRVTCDTEIATINCREASNVGIEKQC